MDRREVEAQIEGLYGALTEHPAVLHVAAVWAPPGQGRWWNIRFGPEVPDSPLDRFVLGVARARADAIVTTGANLRAEPALRHDLAHDGATAAGLASWRRAHRGWSEPARTVVLTRGAGLPPVHPLWDREEPALVVTGEAGRAQVSAVQSGAEMAVLPEPSLRSTLEYLRAVRGYQTISIEVGPSTTAALYGPGPPLVEELMLSQFCGPTLAPSVQGAPFAAPAAVRARLPIERGGAGTAQPSGPWRFSRLLRD